MTRLCLQEEEILAYKVQGFPVLHDKRVKGFKKRDMVQNANEKIDENLHFVEDSNFSTEAAVRRCSGVNSLQNIQVSEFQNLSL